MIAWGMAIGLALILAGAAVSTATMEAAPGQPRKRPLTIGATRAINATALALVVLGILCALAGAVYGIAVEVTR